MLTTHDKQLITRLIKKYSGNSSTDAMLAYVADTGGLLSICKGLIESNNQNDQQAIGWVDEQCFKHQVDVHGFLFEIEQIVSIFQPGHGNSTHYDILGLEEGATDDEVKRAYRILSRKYHPDTASSDNTESSAMFVKITQAYHTLLDGETVGSKDPAPTVMNTQWRNSPKNTISRAQKKKNLLWFGALAMLMIIVSLLVASNYKKRVMLAGLQSSRAAFIPPESALKTEETTQEFETKEVLAAVPPETKIGKEISEEKVAKTIALENEKIDISADIAEAREAMQAPKKAQPPEPARQNQYEAKEVPKSIPPSTAKKLVTTPEEIIIKENITEKRPKAIEKPTKTTRVAKTTEDTQQRIEHFLTAYTKSYEDKDLLSFTRFYDTKATENGKPLAEIITTYSDLFQKSETIALSVTVLKWNRKQTNIHLDGRFQIHIQYKDNTSISGKGQIFILLSDVMGRFEIKELTYQFDTK